MTTEADAAAAVKRTRTGIKFTVYAYPDGRCIISTPERAYRLTPEGVAQVIRTATQTMLSEGAAR